MGHLQIVIGILYHCHQPDSIKPLLLMEEVYTYHQIMAYHGPWFSQRVEHQTMCLGVLYLYHQLDNIKLPADGTEAFTFHQIMVFRGH